ncbi:hypothetical protein SJAG_04836 [Schizosaccharomyces japonicus yFS275]|uniref:WD-like domain-containing protein n=1 Tax=Schizosaccharomyces japonicus (strain yFS275 / FY16936) TaxID=402676 RepID=B6K7W2_SCHJY|nr:hypothetical protein SJAG_04836 [Schizosaccharomyces japonicus yFS275]EEB09616.1 hypothetical protein SJAG_04836 [Schizosaccharomyces japonicus yFS275]
MYSFDNYEKVAKVGAMLKQAQSNEMLGDALYLYNLMDRNGYTHSLALNGSSEFVNETCDFLSYHGLNSTESLASTASSTDLLDFYKNFTTSSCAPTSTWNDDKMKCTSHHKTNLASCEFLYDYIADYGVFPKKPRSLCAKGCCISWSTSAGFDDTWAKKQLKVCLDWCLRYTGSCKLNDVVYEDTHLNFCVSNRGRGCH